MTLNKIKDILVSNSETLAVAESLTVGNLQAMIGSISGASDFFQGGVTTYQEANKVKLLGVDQAHAHQVNCVSQRVANEMAMGVCTVFQTTWGLSTTGYAEARGDISVPFAHYAIVYDDGTTKTVVKKGKIEGKTGMSRVHMQEHVCEVVLNEFVMILEGVQR